MDHKLKTNEMPNRAHHLYVKLYCIRKGERNKKTIQEARNSWLALSLEEKKQFQKTSTKRNLLKYANSLCNTKTFLKEKSPEECDNKFDRPQTTENQDNKLHTTTVASNENNLLLNITKSLDNLINTDYVDDINGTKTELDGAHEAEIDQIGFLQNYVSNTEVIDETINSDNNQEPNEMCIASADKINDTRSEGLLETQSDSNSNQESVVTTLAAPVPPTVKVGKDLYDMMKGHKDKDWKEMPMAERNHYNSAVRSIKREYIVNYTKYLESLSQQELFDHYVKTLK